MPDLTTYEQALDEAGNYNDLRKGKKVKEKISKTRFNINTFGYIFSKLKNLFKDFIQRLLKT